MTDIAAGSIRPPASTIPIDRGPVLVAGGGLILGAIVISQLIDVRQAVLFLDRSGALGLTLYHASFGFTRRLAADGCRTSRRCDAGTDADDRGRCAVHHPLLAFGNPFGTPLAGAHRPRSGSRCVVRRRDFRARHAAWRRVRLGDALHGRRRQRANAGDALAFFIFGALLGTHAPALLRQAPPFIGGNQPRPIARAFPLP